MPDPCPGRIMSLFASDCSMGRCIPWDEGCSVFIAGSSVLAGPWPGHLSLFPPVEGCLTRGLTVPPTAGGRPVLLCIDERGVVLCTEGRPVVL